MALFFSACAKFKNGDSTNTQVSGLMVCNLAPSRTVGVVLGGSLVTNYPLNFTSYTGGYLNVYPGSRALDVFDYTTGDSISHDIYAFAQDKYYSSFILGANNNYRNVIVRDNFDSLTVAAGEAYIRYINAIPDSTAPSVTIAANGTNVFNQNASYASVSDFKAITPGQATISVSNGSTINKSRTITLDTKTAYTVLLVGVPGVTTADSVQVKFVANGILSNTAGRAASSTAGRIAN